MAFVRHNNLFVVDTATLRETALTTDGAARILNGKLDWVYEEEIYGRGEQRGYWWSPDSSRARVSPHRRRARVDLHHARRHQLRSARRDVAVPAGRRSEPHGEAGGRAGCRRRSAEVTWIDTSKYAGADFLIVRVAWNPAGRLVYEVQNRTQSWLDLNVVSSVAADAATTTLFRETSPYWISSEDTTTPTWLADGSFLWLSGRSGFTHAYHYTADGSLLKPVTSGRWELRTLHGVDEKDGWIYFSGTERSPIGGDVYRVRVDGSGFERLSKAAGTHHAEFSPGFGFFIDRWSDVSTPTQVRLHRADGREVRDAPREPRGRAGRLQALETRVRPGEDARRLRHGSHDDQAAGLRPVEALSRLPVHVRRPAQPGSARTSGSCRTCITSCWRSRASSCGSATTGRPAARGSSPRGRCSSTSAKSSCATSRTA